VNILKKLYVDWPSAACIRRVLVGRGVLVWTEVERRGKSVFAERAISASRRWGYG